jgi:hypothetical protein
MTRGQKAAIAAAIVLFGIFIGGVLFTSYQPRIPQAVSVEGAVIRHDFDPRARSPIPFVIVTATSGTASGQFKSDSAGFFRVTLVPKVDTGIITLQFQSRDYRPLDVTIPANTGVYIAQMRPISEEVRIEQPNAPQVTISDVRVRYSIKTRTTLGIGILARTFDVFDTGGLPCRGREPCSPDGKWKAEASSESYDAGKTNEFRDVRVSCIAGPCPFTKITSEPSKEGQMVKVSALSWFGTATFLVEAEVTHAMISDMIRQSYPFIFGDSMSFTLPPAGEGPTVEADVQKTDIVFPLGPDVVLPWADCTVRVDADKSKLYRCELKPGYQFEQQP